MQKGPTYVSASGARRREAEDEIMTKLLADDSIDQGFIDRQFSGSEDREPEAKKRKLNRKWISVSEYNESLENNNISHDQDQEEQTPPSSPSSSVGRPENDESLHDESQQSMESASPHEVDASEVARALGTTSSPTTAASTRTESVTEHDHDNDVLDFSAIAEATEAQLAYYGIKKDGNVFSTTITIDGKLCTKYLHLDESSSLVLKDLQARTKRDVRDEVLRLGLTTAWEGGFLRKLDDVTLLQKSTEQEAAFEKIKLHPDHDSFTRYMEDPKTRFSLEWQETRALSELYINWKRQLFNKNITSERDETGKIIPLNTTAHYTRSSVNEGNIEAIEAEIRRLHTIIERLFDDPRHFQRKKPAEEERSSPFFREVKAHRRELSATKAELCDVQRAVFERRWREEELRVALIEGCWICGNPVHQQADCPENPRNTGARARGGHNGRGGRGFSSGPRAHRGQGGPTSTGHQGTHGGEAVPQAGALAQSSNTISGVAHGRGGGQGRHVSTGHRGTRGGQAMAQAGTSMHSDNIISGGTRGRGGGQGGSTNIGHQGTRGGQGTTPARTAVQGSNSIPNVRGGQAHGRGGGSDRGHQGSRRGHPPPQAHTSTRGGNNIPTARGGHGGGRGGGRGRGQQRGRGGDGAAVVANVADGY